MSNTVHLLAIVGSYRKGGTIDQAVDAMLAAAQECGAETRKIYLIEQQLRYCTNCRSCTQQAGELHGECVLNDGMENLLREVAWADSLIFGSPTNAGSVTAVMKCFIERLISFTYWPWGAGAPQSRLKKLTKRAVLVSSSAAPAVFARLTGDVARLLNSAAKMVGARVVGTLFIGLASQKPQQQLGERAKKKARRLGAQLALRAS